MTATDPHIRGADRVHEVFAHVGRGDLSVADLYADDGVIVYGDGARAEGREAIPRSSRGRSRASGRSRESRRSWRRRRSTWPSSMSPAPTSTIVRSTCSRSMKMASGGSRSSLATDEHDRRRRARRWRDRGARCARRHGASACPTSGRTDGGGAWNAWLPRSRPVWATRTRPADRSDRRGSARHPAARGGVVHGARGRSRACGRAAARHRGVAPDGHDGAPSPARDRSRFRCLRSWEVKDPVPPPELADEACDPRRPREARSPTCATSPRWTGPAEDGPILGLDFRVAELILPVPDFTAW